MQLSLPLPVSPDPANASAGAATSAAGVPGQTAVDPSNVSFDQFLPVGGPAPKPAAKAEPADMENAAATFLASFLMPVSAASPAAPASTAPGKTGPGETSPQAMVSVFFTSPSSRAFVPATPGSVTVTPFPMGKSVPAIGSPMDKVAATARAGTVPTDPPADLTVATGATIQGVPSASPAQFIPSAASGQPGSQHLPDGDALAAEKIAATAIQSGQKFPDVNLPDKKDFLNAGYAAVTKPAAGVGISVAQVAAVMPAVAPNRSKTATAAAVVPVLSASPESSRALSFDPAAPAPEVSLRGTMTAVVTAVAALDRHEGLGQNMLDLQFHVGDQRLALRVELRDGTVHTTFHTESAEMRSALTQEWQAVVPAASREIRLAEPVFSSSPGGGSDTAFGSTGQGAPDQRWQPAPEPVVSGLSPEIPDPVAAEHVPVATTVPSSTPLLQAFA